MPPEDKPGQALTAEPPAEQKAEPKVEKAETPAVKTPTKEELAELNRKNFQPDPEHPRYKEVWAKLKEKEQRLKDLEEDMEAVRRHNREIEAKIDTKGADTEDPEPDPLVDPEGYKKWSDYRIAKERKRHDEAMVKQRLATQIEIQSELHEDYDAVVKLADRDMAKNPDLKKKIWGSENPAKAAYQYGKKKMDEVKNEEKEEANRQENIEKGQVLTPQHAPEEKKEVELTDEEKRVARRLFDDKSPTEAYAKYLKQKKAIGRA